VALIFMFIVDNQWSQKQGPRLVADGDGCKVHRSDDPPANRGAEVEPAIRNGTLTDAIGRSRKAAWAESPFVQIVQCGLIVRRLKPEFGERRYHRKSLCQGEKILKRRLAVKIRRKPKPLEMRRASSRVG
jgi:hypothetical protein